MARDLVGHVAVVTGGARNIGRAIALSLAEGGARVVVAGHTSRDAVEETARLIREAGGEASTAFGDLSRPEEAREVIAAAGRAYGRLDIVVAGAASRSDKSLDEIAPDEWRRIVGSILDATFFCAQAAAPLLKQSGSGTFIAIGGVAAHAGVPGRAHVSAAKAGVVGLVRALAAEWAADGITANCISPGYIATARQGHVPSHFLARPVPLGRPGQPAEVAGAVRYLCGPAGRFVTGQVLHVNGGWHMGT